MCGGPLQQSCTGISSEWSYVTASPSHHDPAIPILSSLHVGHPYMNFIEHQNLAK